MPGFKKGRYRRRFHRLVSLFEIMKTKTPRTAEEMKCTPREGVPVVEAKFAETLELELDEMTRVLRRITDCGGIGPEEMFDDARDILANANVEPPSQRDEN